MSWGRGACRDRGRKEMGILRLAGLEGLLFGVAQRGSVHRQWARKCENLGTSGTDGRSVVRSSKVGPGLTRVHLHGIQGNTPHGHSHYLIHIKLFRISYSCCHYTGRPQDFQRFSFLHIHIEYIIVRLDIRSPCATHSLYSVLPPHHQQHRTLRMHWSYRPMASKGRQSIHPIPMSPLPDRTQCPRATA